MNKGELVEAMAMGADISKSLSDAVGITELQADAALGEFLHGSGGGLQTADGHAAFGVSSVQLSLRATHAGINPQTGATIKAGKKLKGKQVEGQAPFVSFAGEAEPGFVAFEIVYPQGSHHDTPIDVTIPKGTLTFKDGSPVGEVTVTLVNTQPIATPHHHGSTPFLRVSMSTDVVFGNAEQLAKKGMAGPFATAAAVVPGTWNDYLATGDHALLTEALDLDAHAFDASVGVATPPTGCDDKTDTATKADLSAADPASDTKAGDTTTDDTTDDNPKADDPKDTAAPLDGVKETLANLTVSMAKSAGITPEQAAIVVDILTTPGALTVKKGNHVQLIGFGTFSSSSRAARTGRNPQTGKAIKIAARKVVKFKPYKAFQEKLNK